jgi:hypothetical protein
MPQVAAGAAVARTSAATEGAGSLALTGSVQVLAASNSRRIELFIIAGANTVHVGLGKDPSTTTGIPLSSGEKLILNSFIGEVRVLGTAADTVRFVEV